MPVCRPSPQPLQERDVMTAVATAATVAVVTAVPVEATATTQQSKPANKSQFYKQTAALRLKGGCSIMC